MNTKTFWQEGTHLSIFLGILFVGCFFWYYFRAGTSEMKILHETLLRQAYFGWTGMNISSFFAGLIQTFAWGYIGLALWNLAGLITGLKNQKK